MKLFVSGRKHEELVHLNRDKETTLSSRNSPGLSGTIGETPLRVAIINVNIRPSLHGLGDRRCDSISISYLYFNTVKIHQVFLLHMKYKLHNNI